jgi:hypothetical protein
MSCKGICIRHKASKPAATLGRYTIGQKRCRICDIFVKCKGVWYLCCCHKLRTRPRGRKYRMKLLRDNEFININKVIV